MTTSRAHDEQLLAINGIEICVQTFGDPKAPATLLIGGAESSMDWWEDEFCELLAGAGRYVIRYDTRDTGRSTTFPLGEPPYAVDDLIADALGVLDELGIDTAHVVAVSLGGRVAQHLAMDHADRIASLTLIATSPDGPAGPNYPDLPPMSERLAEYFEQGGEQPDWSDREAVIEYFIGAQRMLAGAIPLDEQALRRVVGRVWDRSPAPASAQNHWLLDGGAPVRDRLGEIAAPTVVLHGTADPLLPIGHGEAVAREIPNARLVPLDGMGHQMPPSELWDTVIAQILAISNSRRS